MTEYDVDDIIGALDLLFDFIPPSLLDRLKKEGFYDPILAGKLREGAELYDYISAEHAAIQDADYSALARNMAPHLNPGSILQIGCGMGDLLRRFSKLDFAPLFGIDRSETMLSKARDRLNGNETHLYTSRIEDFDLAVLPKIDNIIINNFWGLLSEAASRNLLERLKAVQSENAIILIGAYHPIKKGEQIENAERILKSCLDFTFAYPFFLDFHECSYRQEKLRISGKTYFKLRL